MPQNTFFRQTHDLLVRQRLFWGATATVVAFVLLRNSMFNFHCYTQREATPTQKSARKWSCNLSRLLARKITKGIHSCKPASLNCPIGMRSGRKTHNLGSTLTSSSYLDLEQDQTKMMCCNQHITCHMMWKHGGSSACLETQGWGRTAFQDRDFLWELFVEISACWLLLLFSVLAICGAR